VFGLAEDVVFSKPDVNLGDIAVPVMNLNLGGPVFGFASRLLISPSDLSYWVSDTSGVDITVQHLLISSASYSP